VRTLELSIAALVASSLAALAAGADPAYVPAPADQVPGYSAQPMPCRIVSDEGPTHVSCKGDLLEHKSLRELSILRNTIYARYGWDGYRKPWLRDYFHGQHWFKPNPKFSYKQLSEADRKNAHFVGVREQSMGESELHRMQDDIYARHGKIWNDKPEWSLKSGKKVHSCKPPRELGPVEEDESEGSRDCRYATQKWYHPDPKFSEDRLTTDEKIEMGLISRALGSFALDQDARGKVESSLDRVLALAELRALSLRDLRLLRNTIYARRGRPFKSEVLRDHFAQMTWYKVEPSYTDKLLSKNDQRNIALIKSVENELGGPLSDEDWLIEPAVDGA
jgi:hypothetical protein